MKRSNTFSIALLVVVLMLVAGCAPAQQAAQPAPPPTAAPTKVASALDQALAGNYNGKTVSVGGYWGGEFASNYQKSLDSFEEKTGITIAYQQIDPYSSSFIATAEAGEAPDVVEFPNLTSLQYWAKHGKLVNITSFVDMDTLRTRYDQNWLDWATWEGPDGPIMAGVWGAAFLDSMVWYPKAAFDQAGYQIPTTWEELLALSDQIVQDGGTPWCIENGFWGGGSTGTSAARWIGDIMLRTTSPEDYDKWVRGELKFNSPQVKRSVELMSDLWFKPGYVYGGRQALNATYQWVIGHLMLSTPPKCWLLMEPSWTTGYDGKTTHTAFWGKEFGKDYDFFLLPPIDQAYGTPLQVDAHITGMFHDRPEVRALMEYLTTGEQLETWVQQDMHFGYSPHKDAKLEWYADTNGQRAVAEAVRNADTLGIVAHDSMWYTLMMQFPQSISAYVDGDIDLDAALNQIDAAAPSPESATTP